jgi:SRSO17 transposase
MVIEMDMENRELDTAYINLMNRIADIFPGEPGFANAKKYISGLMSPIARKNGWQLSEAVGEATPYSLQQFIYRGRFSSDALRDRLIKYVNDELGEEDGVLVVDDTGFLKKGKMSCGVNRQYTVTAGKVENCQIGVFLTYSSTKGHSPIDRRLYIPQCWFDEPERCVKAGIPKTVKFQTKPEMALEMAQNALASGVAFRWVVGDCAYGDIREFRSWLEEVRKCYVLCVSGKEYIQIDGVKTSISNALKELDENLWFEASCGGGSKGERKYNWQILNIDGSFVPGFKHHLLVRRSLSDPADMRAHICFAPEGTTEDKLIKITGTRWTVESCFAEGKSEVGMDQYEVRSYSGWYKFITFSCIALALLTVMSCNSLDKTTMQQHSPGTSSLDEFKKGPNLRV